MAEEQRSEEDSGGRRSVAPH